MEIYVFGEHHVVGALTIANNLQIDANIVYATILL